MFCHGFPSKSLQFPGQFDKFKISHVQRFLFTFFWRISCHPHNLRILSEFGGCLQLVETLEEFYNCSVSEN